MINNKNILITGGTGSFGRSLTSFLLKNYKPKKIIIFSRDELKQSQMMSELNNNKFLRFFIGDVRDYPRLKLAMRDVEYVFHAAALKHVPLAEYNPFEAVKTNILGAQNIIDASYENNVKNVLALSTDKASSPVNIYGATKLASDKLFIAANNYKGKLKTKFSVVRYGNVMGSRGSVIPIFSKLLNQDYFPITDKRMTRFFISLDDSVKFVMKSLIEMDKGEIFIPKMPSVKIKELIKTVNPRTKIKEVGIRPGEKIDELLISKDESSNTVETNNNFIIFPKNPHVRSNLFKRYKSKKRVTSFEYSSKNNKEFLSSKELSILIKKIK